MHAGRWKVHLGYTHSYQLYIVQRWHEFRVPNIREIETNQWLVILMVTMGRHFKPAWNLTEAWCSRIAQRNFPNLCASKIAQRRLRKLAKKSIEDRSTKKFPTDARRRLLKEDFGSRRRSPSKIVPRKFPNQSASKIAQRGFRKSASFYRRSLHENFPTDANRKLPKEDFGNRRRSLSKIAWD